MNRSLNAVNRNLFISVSFLALCAFYYNFFVTQYPGNHYYPGFLVLTYVEIGLLYMGFRLISGRESYFVQMSKELFFILLVYGLIAFTTTSVQYTPFQPIDDKIISLERAIYFSMPAFMAWANQWPVFYSILSVSYQSINNQLLVLPFLLCLLGEFQRLRQFYFLMLFTTALGFPVYYFFPTTAPASHLSSPFFLPAQYATGIKFYEIHHYIPPSTIAGGMIALPSFHVIWAWIMVYLVRPWSTAYKLLLLNNSLLTVSCLLLGWHYLTDIVSSFIILFLALYAMRSLLKNQSESTAKGTFSFAYK